MTIWITIFCKRRWIYPQFLSIKCCKRPKKLDAINEWGSVVALSYVAAQRTMFEYNDMADAKAMLESIARSFGYIYGREKTHPGEYDFPVTDNDYSGERNQRFRFAGRLCRPDVAPWKCYCRRMCNYCVCLFSDLTRKITMQNLYHDGGFSSMGMSYRAMHQYNKSFDNEDKK